MPDTALHAALVYHSRRFSVIPFYHRTKKPAVGKGNIYQYRRGIASVAQVETWFATGEWNVGLVTGAVSRLLVADIDLRNGGDHSIRGLPWPPTPTVDSHDGIKALFRHDGGLPTRKDALPGVDLLSEKSQFLVPPSIHPQGTPYAWHDMLDLTDLDLSPSPPWILDLIHTPSSTANPPAPHKNQDTEDGRAPVLVDTCTTPNYLTPQEVRVLFASPEANQAVAKFLGLPALGDSFLCFWHPERKRSMSLYADPHTGAWKVHDHHGRGEHEHYGLPDIFASHMLRREVRLVGKPSLTAWWLRALLASKYLEPAEVPMKVLPLDARPSIRTVYDGFILLLQAKWRYDPGKPTQFTVRFAMAWCGISSSETVQKAVWWLVWYGYIRQVKREKGSWTYLPGEE